MESFKAAHVKNLDSISEVQPAPKPEKSPGIQEILNLDDCDDSDQELQEELLDFDEEEYKQYLAFMMTNIVDDMKPLFFFNQRNGHGEESLPDSTTETPCFILSPKHASNGSFGSSMSLNHGKLNIANLNSNDQYSQKLFF